MSKNFIKIAIYSIITLIVVFSISHMISVYKIINSDAYRFAIDQISNNERVIEDIGRIKEFDKYPTGKLRKNVAQIETNVIAEKRNTLN